MENIMNDMCSERCNPDLFCLGIISISDQISWLRPSRCIKTYFDLLSSQSWRSPKRRDLRDETKNMSRFTIQICKNLHHRCYVHLPINSYSYLVLNQFFGFWEKISPFIRMLRMLQFEVLVPLWIATNTENIGQNSRRCKVRFINLTTANSWILKCV